MGEFSDLISHTCEGLVFLFICYLLGSYNGVQGSVKLSRQEELKLEKQLKLLNKPSAKTIMTDHGELYDCVDFYKQPAFDHPLLKNHSYHFQMKPRFPAERKDQPSPQGSLYFGLKDGGCPSGKVLIKRTTKEDLMRRKFSSKDPDLRNYFKVVGHSKDGAKYTGALGLLSSYKPEPVQALQFSSARIHIENDEEFIEYGWRVDPTLYGDSATHFYIQTNVYTTRCFDTACGFVVTNPDLSPGRIIPYISTIGGVIYETKPRVQRDNDGNWWLSLEKDNKHLGFWPKELFTKLVDYATYVDWGGEAYSPPSTPAPPMGSGIMPKYSYDRKVHAYFRWIAGIDLNGNDFNPDLDLDGYDPLSMKYNIIEERSSDPVWGHQLYFGGKTQS